MERRHKHGGIVQYKQGKEFQKIHSVKAKHRDIYAVRCHNMELGRYAAIQKAKGKKVAKPKAKAKTVKQIRKQVEKKSDDVTKAFEEQKFTRMVLCPVDKDGYAYFDLMGLMVSEHITGVRIRFERQAGRKKRVILLQIEKD